MDSRDYICPLTINCLSDVPADFETPPGLPASACGLFLPRSDPDWLGRSAHPPSVVLLDRDFLFVIPHPAARAHTVRWPLHELESIECGRILLLGWIRLKSWEGQQFLPYNRRSAPIVERFLLRLRTRWLSTRAGLASTHPVRLGKPLSDKFARSVSWEAAGLEEKFLVQFFQPPVRCTRWRVFHLETWRAGDFIALTDRRILWITERHRAAYERYGAVSRSAPCSMIARIGTTHVQGKTFIEIVLHSGETWGIEVHRENVDDGQAFAGLAAELLSADRKPRREPMVAGEAT